jgi:Lysine-specific metallo-endopeptidase
LLNYWVRALVVSICPFTIAAGFMPPSSFENPAAPDRLACNAAPILKFPLDQPKVKFQTGRLFESSIDNHDLMTLELVGHHAVDINFQCKCCIAGPPPTESSPLSKTKGSDVETLLTAALNKEKQLLLVKKQALQRWNSQDQRLFLTWFGTTSSSARDAIQKRIDSVLKLNQAYKTTNFRAASPSKPGVFAYVHPQDTSRIYLDREFFRAGGTERGGTLAHEMSHFQGTDDHTYGPEPCKKLARQSPTKAMQNADNFEFYLEGRR